MASNTINQDDYENPFSKLAKWSGSKQASISIIKELAPFSSTFTFLASSKKKPSCGIDLTGTRFGVQSSSCL